MNDKLCIIGLGYVGLPLAVEFAKKYEVTGFDINKIRVNELKNNIDKTLELKSDDIKNAKNLSFTNEISKDANIYIITVPTPVDKNKNPNLVPLIQASKSVAKVLKKDDIVVYESTVYPGAVEEKLVPILEDNSKLKFNKDFFCAYSPERINPGDKKHTLTNIIKITSGSNEKTANKIDKLYKSIIKAGTYKAPNIKTAEAAKVIENTQRDINIAFINELAQIFNKLEIDTSEVLKAACTKWNFLDFKPGLVGGHCIGVDPFYLAFKAKEVGYNPEIILAGRKINDSMPSYVANKIVKLMAKKDVFNKASKVLMLGISFKENCPDIRNSKLIELVSELKDFGLEIDIYDPLVDKEELKKEHNLSTINKLDFKDYACIILGVAHKEFKNLDIKGKVIYDLKSFLKNSDERL